MKDKVIVITGASAGIGASLAERAVAQGARVVLAARREPELKALAERLGAAERIAIVVADVTSRADNERLVKTAVETFGQLDVFVANAGRGITRPVSELTDADVDDMFTTNFKSVLYGIQASLPTFKTQQRGQFIAVSSMLGKISFTPIRSAYSAAKAAVNSLVASFRLELAAEYPNIHATTVLPGVVATDFGKAALHGGPDSRSMPTAQPVEEVADVILGAITDPRPEVYTRPEARGMIAGYYTADDVRTIEAKFAQQGPPRR